MGKYTRTRVPLPGSLSTSTEPPCCCTSPYTVARPSPVPLPSGFVVKNGSKMRRLVRSEEHTSELQSQSNLVCRLLLEKKKKKYKQNNWTATLHAVTDYRFWLVASSDTVRTLSDRLLFRSGRVWHTAHWWPADSRARSA